MSIMTSIQNLRFQRKVTQEITNAGEAEAPKTSTWKPVWVVPFALAFVFALAAIAAPAHAEINLSFVGPMFTSLFGALEDIIPSAESFIDVGFPFIIKLMVYGAILAVISMIVIFGKGLLDKIVGHF